MISSRGFPAAVELDLLTYWELDSAILHHKCVVFVLLAKGNTEEASWTCSHTGKLTVQSLNTSAVFLCSGLKGTPKRRGSHWLS